MSYTASDASQALNEYLGIVGQNREIIPNTKNRGIVITLPSSKKAVLFIYPLVHKQDNTKNYFDTRDSGPRERAVAWNYAISNNFKYFCLGLNSQVDKYVDYVFSLECDEHNIELLSGTVNGERSTDTSGNQIIIPNSFVPDKPFERIKNNLGTFISVINRNSLIDYLEMFDNRPYMINVNLVDLQSDNDVTETPNTNTLATGGTNKIYYGAPGCGKSRHVSDMLRKAHVSEENTVRATFHPEYSNVDFIGQILPTVTKDENNGEDIVKYIFNPGSFSLALQKAYNTTDMVYLIIEEINRGNAAAIFGDMFQLLDREVDSTKPNYCASEYPVNNPNLQKYLIEHVSNETIKERLSNGVYIPSNLTIFATMNSSDQNVFTLDTAFKRRWRFEQISNDISRDASHSYKHWYVPGTDVTWEDFLNSINDRILDYKIHNQTNEDKRLGKYFVTQNCLTKDIQNIKDVQDEAMEFAYKVLEYIWNDVCKIGREDWFDTEEYRTLEDAISAFKSPKDGDTPLSVFQNITFKK